MPLRNRNIVYRVQGIPVGSEVRDVYHAATKELSSSTPQLARDFITSVLESFVPSGPPKEQAEQLLCAAIKLQELVDTGAEVTYGAMTADIVPSCQNDDTRTAIIYFEDDRLPKFLGGNRALSKAETMIQFGGHDLDFDKKFTGMTQLYEPTGGVIRADIIAVPGLDGHAYGSWKAKEKGGRMWLQDFFRRDFADCRTFIYGNNTRLGEYNVSTLEDYGRELLDDLSKIRQKEEERNRPLYLLGHSFGGLVIENALCIDDYAEAQNQNIVFAVHGIIFFGVPHRGLNTDDMKKLVEKANPRGMLLKEIEENSPHLQKQVEEFKHLVRKRDMHIVSFYERQQTRGIEQLEPTAASTAKAKYGRVSDNRYLSVDTNSAVLNLPPNLESPFPADADHSGIVKITGSNRKMYGDIKHRMKELMRRNHASVDQQRHGIRALTQIPNHAGQFQSAVGTRIAGTQKDVIESKIPRMTFSRLALLANGVLKFCLVLFQKASMLYLKRHSLHFDDPIRRMREEYGDLGSCQWILNKADCPEYAAWREAKEPRFILIESGPGYGKTNLASFLSEQEDNDHSVTLHFFSGLAREATGGPSSGLSSAKNKIPADRSSQNREPRKKDASNTMPSHKKNEGSVEEVTILRALLWQLADKLHGENKVKILRTIVDKRRKQKALSRDVELFDSGRDMWDIITNAPGVSEIRLIIDDVHYCDKKFIKRLTGELGKPASKVAMKAILTARSGGFKLDFDTLDETLKSKLLPLHLTTSEGVKADAKKYVMKRLKDMAEDFELGKEFTDPLEQQTLEKTENFLWAKVSLDKMGREFETWIEKKKEQPWEFTPEILPADDLTGVLNSLLEEVSEIGLQIIKWAAMTYDASRMVIPLKEKDFQQMFRYSDKYPNTKPESVVVERVVMPAACIDNQDKSVKALHPSLMDHVREKLITDEDRRDLAVICLKYLCTNQEYIDASLELLNSGFFTEKELTKLLDTSSKVLGFNGNTRSQLLTHIMLYWPDHVSILGDGLSDFERLQEFYAPGKRYFEAWHHLYRVVMHLEDDPSMRQSWVIYGPKKTSLLHIVANRGTLNLFKRCLPMSRSTMGSTMEPRIPFRWHANRVRNPAAPVLDYQDEQEGSLLILALSNSSTSEIAQYLISQGADVDAPGSYNRNHPLTWSGENYELTLSLMKRGVKDPDHADNVGDTPLMSAVMNGSPAEVVALLCSTGRVNVNRKNDLGSTPILEAAWYNNLAAAKVLLACKETDINATDSWGFSALLAATICGNDDFIKLLLERPELNVDQAPVATESFPQGACLGLAAMYGQQTTVELLLKDPRINVNPTPEMVKNNHALHPLSFAARYGHEAVIPILLRDPRTEANFKGCKGITPLRSAARSGSVSIVNMLLCCEDVDIDAKDEDGLSPLTCAVQSGHAEVAQVLIDSNATPDPQRLFKEAVLSETGDTNGGVLRWVLDHYLDEIDIMITDEDGRCALMWAARDGKTSSVEILLNRWKLDPNRTSKKGQTALIEAAEQGHLKVVKALMEDDRLKLMEHRDKDGRTPLSYAAEEGHADVVNWLLGAKEAGKSEEEKDGLLVPPKIKMDPNTAGPKGSTAIIEAAKLGNTAVIEVLQHYEEADFNHVDDEGRNALSYAAGSGHVDAVKVLVEGRPVKTEPKPKPTDSAESKKDGDDRTQEKAAVEKAETSAKKPDGDATTNESEKVPNQKMMDPNFTDPKGRTPLIEAAQAGHKEVMEFLLSHGKVNVSHQDKEGRTALYHAAENNHVEVVNLLLEGVMTRPREATVDGYCSTEKGYPYLITCVAGDSRPWSLRRTYSDFQDLKQALLKEFMHESGKTGQTRILPYMPGPVSELTESIVKARMQCLNDYIKTLLKTPEKVSKSLLVRKFFSPRPGDVETTPDKAGRLSANNHKGPGGRTPLIEVARKGHAEVVRVLVEHENAALNHRDDEGRSALIYAVEKGFLAVCRLLLEGGKTNKDVRDKAGKTPVEYVDVKHVYGKDIMALLKGEKMEPKEVITGFMQGYWGSVKAVRALRKRVEEKKKQKEGEKQKASEEMKEEGKSDAKTEGGDGESKKSEETGSSSDNKTEENDGESKKSEGTDSSSDNKPETSKPEVNPPDIGLPTPPADTETPPPSTPQQLPATPEPNPDTIELTNGSSAPPSPARSSPPTSAPASPEQTRECQSCGTAFNSRTKLLIHLREAGHREAGEEAGENNDGSVEATELMAG